MLCQCLFFSVFVVLVTSAEQEVTGLQEIEWVREIIWSNVTADELSKIPPETFVNVSKADMNELPPESCAGFTSAQIAMLNSTAVCNHNLHCSLIQVLGFTASHVSYFPSYVCSSISAAQAMNFVGTTFRVGGWHWDCLSQWTPETIGSITSDQVQFQFTSLTLLCRCRT